MCYDLDHFGKQAVSKHQFKIRFGPAGDGETQEVSVRCLMSLSVHLSRPIGLGPPCSHFIKYILVLCL